MLSEFSGFSQSQKTKTKPPNWSRHVTSDTEQDAFQYRMIPAIATSVVIHQTVPFWAREKAFPKLINTVITVDKVSVLQFILITCSSSLSSRSSKCIEPFAQVSRWSIEGSDITTNGEPIFAPTQAKFKLNPRKATQIGSVK